MNDNLAYRAKPLEEWEQGKHVVSTKKAMREALAKGVIQFCSLCGVNVPEKAISDPGADRGYAKLIGRSN